MKKIIEVTKRENFYSITILVNDIILGMGNSDKLPVVHKYNIFKRAKGWISFNDINIDYDELIFNGEKI